MSRIAVIIVNYQAAELVTEAVESVRAKAPDAEIHLIDNASPDGDAAVLQEAHATRGWGAQVQLYLEETNHGFGRGNNIAIRVLAERPTPPDYVFLLNPDAQLKNNAIAILANFLDTHQDVAVAGAGIEKPSGIPVTAAFRFPSIASEFAGAVNFGPVSRLFARWAVPLSPDCPEQAVSWVSGAAFMVRYDVILQHGGFDPDFFLYYEEVELMHRIRSADWQIWHVPEAQVIHIEGATTGVRHEAQRRRRPAYWYESWRLYFTKCHGRGYTGLAAMAWASGALLNYLIVRLRGHPPSAPLYLFPDLWSGVIRPLLGLKARRDV